MTSKSPLSLNPKSLRAQVRRTAAVLVLTLPPLTLLPLAGCSGGGALQPAGGVTQNFDFNAGMQGWTAGVADVPTDYDPEFYEIGYAVAPLPASLDTSRRALRLTDNNHSDDLWHFVKRRISGLKPNTAYRLRFDVEIASDSPSNSAGVGGSPGSSVILKAGAAVKEPDSTVDSTRNYLVFNLDKGNQTTGGTQGYVLGTVGIPGDETVYQLKNLNNASRSFPVTTDANGQVWVYVGADSGFEGQKVLYYTDIKLTFNAA